MTNSKLQHDIGQLLMCGFHGLEPTKEILDLIRNHNLGSVILFSRNIETPEQVQQLTYKLQQAAKEAGHERPLFIAVDQENGVVRRLGTSGTYLPGSMALGAIDDESAAAKVAAATAKELLALGINWNLAPVLDVNNNPLNPVIGVRSFGEDPAMVSRLGRAQVEAYQAHRVATSIKHFPGHGDTATDSHLGIPVIEKDVGQLESLELIPFREAIEKSQPASVMVGHISLPKIIKKKKQPASISSEVVTDLLRRKYRYDGVIITDCLEMDAVKDSVGSARGAVMALQAGNDIAMLSHTYKFQKGAFELINQAIETEQLCEQSLKISLDRVARLKEKFLTWEIALQKHDLSTVGCSSHTKLSEQLYNAVPTIIRDEPKLLPLQPKDKSKKILFLAAHVPLTLAIDSESEPFNSMYSSIQRRHENTEYIIFDEKTTLSKQQIIESDTVIIGTANANLHPFQSSMVQFVSQHTKNLIVIAVINPYDLMAFSNNVGTYIVTYEYTPPAHEASIRLIFGETENDSKSPVTILPTPIDKTTIYNVDDVSASKEEFAKAYELWNNVYGSIWPLPFVKFKLILSRMQQPRHFAVYNDAQQMIGFAATQTMDSQGQLALLVVHSEYRRKGIGSQLHNRSLEWFSQQKVQHIMLGATYPRFFCGVPHQDGTVDDNKEAQAFFEHRGYTFTSIVWDLKGDLSDYTVPESIQERMKREDIWIGPISTKEQAQEVIDLQKKDFPYWISTYQHHLELGDCHDIIVAREGSSEGKLLGSLVLYTAQGSHPSRTDLVWIDEKLFGKDSGGLACVGVATEQRGRGIGLGLVAYANLILKERGVRMSYVDWVELTDFYGRTGYQKWRSYKLGAKK